MGRFLGIDYGKRRIGLAISDPLNIFATGLETIEFSSDKQMLKELQDVIAKYSVEGIVIGLPLRTTGEVGVAAKEVQQFGDLLLQSFSVPIFYEDERFTSVIAQQTLREQGIKPSRQKHLVDKTSAALILQQYLDRSSLKK